MKINWYLVNLIESKSLSVQLFFFIKLSTYVALDKRMDCIDFKVRGQGHGQMLEGAGILHFL